MGTSNELTGAREREKDESFYDRRFFAFLCFSGQRLCYVSPGLFVNKSLYVCIRRKRKERTIHSFAYCVCIILWNTMERNCEPYFSDSGDGDDDAQTGPSAV